MSKLQTILADVMSGDILEDNKTHKNRIQIRSQSSDVLYVVAQSKRNGQWQCSCLGWIYKRKCKHLTAMSPVLALGDEVEALPAPKKVSKKKTPAKKVVKKAKTRKKVSV